MSANMAAWDAFDRIDSTIEARRLILSKMPVLYILERIERSEEGNARIVEVGVPPREYNIGAGSLSVGDELFVFSTTRHEPDAIAGAVEIGDLQFYRRNGDTSVWTCEVQNFVIAVSHVLTVFTAMKKWIPARSVDLTVGPNYYPGQDLTRAQLLMIVENDQLHPLEVRKLKLEDNYSSPVGYSENELFEFFERVKPKVVHSHFSMVLNHPDVRNADHLFLHFPGRYTMEFMKTLNVEMFNICVNQFTPEDFRSFGLNWSEKTDDESRLKIGIFDGFHQQSMKLEEFGGKANAKNSHPRRFQFKEVYEVIGESVDCARTRVYTNKSGRTASFVKYSPDTPFPLPVHYILFIVW